MVYDWYIDETNKRSIINYADVLAHRGETHLASHTFTIASDATVGFVIVPNGVQAHGRISVDYSAAGQYKLCEGASLGGSAHGTLIEDYGQNRNLTTTAYTSSVSCYHTPTVIDIGTSIENGSLGGTGLFVESGGIGNISGHWILESTTTYVVQIYNVSGSEATFTVKYNWHE